MFQEFGTWDLLLLLVVTVQATTLAYLHDPRWKALMLALPIPFTLASMAVGAQVGASHVLGLALLLIYTHGVRLLHVRLGTPIIPAIVISAAAYALLGAALAAFLPAGETAFWVSAAATFAVAFAALRLTAHRAEPGHRTPLPVWLKAPIILGVILLLILSKKMLQGFMATFPMVGVVAAYEARHSLWTICRTVAAFILCATPMMAAAHLAYPHVGLAGSLGIGWAVFLGGLAWLISFMWRERGTDE